MPIFELWKRAGTWEYVHPWMETVLPWETAATYIEQVLVDLSPAVQVGGHVLLWPARSTSRSGCSCGRKGRTWSASASSPRSRPSTGRR